ncbi:MAG: cytidine deaminase [Clostridia bacterium]|nr:cytidine deaminase [Clostridia bacterium]
MKNIILNNKVWDARFLRISGVISEASSCCRKHVGALVVKNKRIISTGYNGVPSGLKHCNQIFSKEDMLSPNFMERHGDFSNKFEVHAEQNCIAELSKNEVSAEGATLYSTLAPCSNCAKLIVAAGIKRVVYAEEYDRDMSGPDLLKQSGIIVDHLPWTDDLFNKE